MCSFDAKDIVDWPNFNAERYGARALLLFILGGSSGAALVDGPTDKDGVCRIQNVYLNKESAPLV